MNNPLSRHARLRLAIGAALAAGLAPAAHAASGYAADLTFEQAVQAVQQARRDGLQPAMAQPGSQLDHGAGTRDASPQLDPQTGLPYVSTPGPQPQTQSAPQFDKNGKAYKGYGAAALEILGFQVALNRFDNAFAGPDYHVTLGTIRRNLHSSWVVDRDPFEVNQLGHPYQGSVYYNIARSNGLNFWESMGYAFGGSAVWEVAGESTRPSRNDQITTSFGGTFLGEALYRMANLVMEQGYGLDPGERALAMGVISPALFVNRSMRPGRGSDLFASNNPALYWRWQAGAGTAIKTEAGPAATPARTEAAVDFLLDYGLPGKPGYEYRRPFDYFRFQLRASTLGGIETLGTRGLLFGGPYAAGSDLRGILGIYGSYDYIAPQLFRVASTAVSLGSNAQWRMSDALVLQGHASGGMGYTSTGTVRGTSDREYNYGFAPEAMVSLRLVMGNNLLLDTTAREFFNGRLSNSETGGTDRVVRADASLTWRISGNHALALRYITSRRNFDFPDVTAGHQRRDTLGLYYVYQEAKGFGVVNW
ncbi:DUF3943 domain-containing protein [Massilia sp. 9096]|uniref:DUF3943 domain-containing protein n=1 Tax=Massilia sp. 9096 TaxID=1500894 RepID=UPI00068A0F06|nr:DUF3943 domain-containing protein [Massilia sp. 9096]